MWKIARRLVLPLVLLCAGTAGAEEVKPLPALGADLQQVSVSGISSGGFMAAQLATAYSATFKGVGVIAGGPFYCSGSYGPPTLAAAFAVCLEPQVAAVGPNGKVLLQKAEKFERQNDIDELKNLARQRVYIFSGLRDKTVKTMVVDQIGAYYSAAGTPPGNIMYQRHEEAGHAIMTDDNHDPDCKLSTTPFINNCGFMQSHVLLKFILGQQSKPANPASKVSGEIIAFDQSRFIHGERVSMDKVAYLYVPAYCRANSCGVHVALHGCLQNAGRLGALFYTHTGYNEFADTNHLLVLYPQTADEPVFNPKGCWDFWGYSDAGKGKPEFYTRRAPQMRAIMEMVQQLGQPRI